MTADDRTEALQALIELRKPIQDVVDRLRAFPWDSETAFVTLGGNEIVRVLDRYLAGSVDNADLETWANAIEGRDDLAYDPSREVVLKHVIFECANPLLSGPITSDTARRWKDEIQGERTST
ncbi:MAG: hypothetical protein ACYC1D_08405 [Acidimicrobiales bacterium]